MGEMGRSTNRISFAGLPFFLESGDIEITYWFAILVEHTDLPYELLSNG